MRKEIIAALLTPFGLLANAQPGKEKPLPNIVYILADDLGYGDRSCYIRGNFQHQIRRSSGQSKIL